MGILDQALGRLRYISSVASRFASEQCNHFFDTSGAIVDVVSEVLCLRDGPLCRRPWQGKAVERVLESGRVLLRAPTGSGKTLVGLLSALLSSALDSEPLFDGTVVVPRSLIVVAKSEQARRYVEDWWRIIGGGVLSRVPSEARCVAATVLAALSPVPLNGTYYTCPVVHVASVAGIDVEEEPPCATCSFKRGANWFAAVARWGANASMTPSQRAEVLRKALAVARSVATRSFGVEVEGDFEAAGQLYALAYPYCPHELSRSDQAVLRVLPITFLRPMYRLGIRGIKSAVIGLDALRVNVDARNPGRFLGLWPEDPSEASGTVMPRISMVVVDEAHNLYLPQSASFDELSIYPSTARKIVAALGELPQEQSRKTRELVAALAHLFKWYAEVAKNVGEEEASGLVSSARAVSIGFAEVVREAFLRAVSVCGIGGSAVTEVPTSLDLVVKGLTYGDYVGAAKEFTRLARTVKALVAVSRRSNVERRCRALVDLVDALVGLLATSLKLLSLSRALLDGVKSGDVADVERCGGGRVRVVLDPSTGASVSLVSYNVEAVRGELDRVARELGTDAKTLFASLEVTLYPIGRRITMPGSRALLMSGTLPKSIATMLGIGEHAYIDAEELGASGGVVKLELENNYATLDWVRRNAKQLVARWRSEWSRGVRGKVVVGTRRDWQAIAESVNGDLGRWFRDVVGDAITSGVDRLVEQLKRSGWAFISMHGTIAEGLEAVENGTSLIREMEVLRLSPGEINLSRDVVDAVTASQMGMDCETYRALVALTRLRQVLGRATRSEKDSARIRILDGARLRKLRNLVDREVLRQIGFR